MGKSRINYISLGKTNKQTNKQKKEKHPADIMLMKLM